MYWRNEEVAATGITTFGEHGATMFVQGKQIRGSFSASPSGGYLSFSKDKDDVDSVRASIGMNSEENSEITVIASNKSSAYWKQTCFVGLKQLN